MSSFNAIHVLSPDDEPIINEQKPFYYYPCHLKRTAGKWVMTSNKWVSKENVTIDAKTGSKQNTVKFRPKSYSFTPQAIGNFLCDLLDRDFSKQKHALREFLRNYEDVNSKQDSVDNGISELILRFQETWNEIHPYFVLISFELLRDELIVFFHNKLISSLQDKNEEILITAEFIDSYMNNLFDYIMPFLKTMYSYDIEISDYTVRLRQYLLRRILEGRRIGDCRLQSPTQTIYDSLDFLDSACNFLNEYRNELINVSDRHRLYICIRVFANSQIRKNYESYVLKSIEKMPKKGWSKHHTTGNRMKKLTLTSF